jgi:hypothetical protein
MRFGTIVFLIIIIIGSVAAVNFLSLPDPGQRALDILVEHCPRDLWESFVHLL